jgi:hypothetical protein
MATMPEEREMPDTQDEFLPTEPLRDEGMDHHLRSCSSLQCLGRNGPFIILTSWSEEDSFQPNIHIYLTIRLYSSFAAEKA